MDLEDQDAPESEPISLKGGLGPTPDQISFASSRHGYSVGLPLLRLEGGDLGAYSILESKGKTCLILDEDAPADNSGGGHNSGLFEILGAQY